MYESSSTCYLLDFNLSKRFRDSRTLSHIPYKENANLVGTARYASINAHLGVEQSRRDDLESIGYILVYFLKGYLPWQGIKAGNKQEKYQKILEKKITTPPEILCEDLPDEFSIYLNYCRSLGFDDKPDYNFIKNLFNDLFKENNYENNLYFDWMNPLIVFIFFYSYFLV